MDLRDLFVRFKNDPALWLCPIAVLCFGGTVWMGAGHRKSHDHPVYFAPPPVIKHFAFGFPDLYADLLWVRLLQDVDFCASEKGLPKYDGKTSYQCEKGWSYKVTDTLTELAPRFLKAYIIAGSIMGVIMGDQEGAKAIYDKGLKRFPNNWRLLFGAGHHYLSEIQDREKGAELLLRSAQNGGPLWLYDLSATQYEKTGNTLIAYKILQDFSRNCKALSFCRHIRKRLSALKKQLQHSPAFP